MFQYVVVQRTDLKRHKLTCLMILAEQMSDDHMNVCAATFVTT